MRQKLGKKIYDTETAELLHVYTNGNWGDPAGYEERLFRTDDGFYFVWGLGGETSPYPCEKIKRLAKSAVSVYLSERNA